MDKGTVVQVLERPERECPGERVFRVALDPETDLASLHVVPRRGPDRSVVLPAHARWVGPWEPDPSRLVASVRVPGGVECFDVLDDAGELLLRQTTEATRALVARRDAGMVNPGIDPRYAQWRLDHPVEDPELADGPRPLFSIVVPLFHTPRRFLEELLDSVLAQTYGRWELVLVNATPDDRPMAEVLLDRRDPRIRVIELPGNLGIVGNTNAGIPEATGDYVLFADHDDTLDPHLLAWYARAVQDEPEVDLLYCDEDSFSEMGRYFEPRFKPDFSLDLLRSNNYVCHCLGVSRRALGLVEPAPDETNGAQDYDLTLKVAEVARAVRHVPQVLYHWRQHEGSTNGGVMTSKPYAIEAGRRAIAAHYERLGIDATVAPTEIPCVYDTVYAAPSGDVDLVVLADSQAGLEAFLGALDERDGLTVWAVGEGLEPVTGAQVVPCDGAGFAERAQAGLAAGDAPLVVVCGEGTRFEPGALEVLLGYAAREEVGVAAPRSLYNDGLLEDGGVAVTRGGRLLRLNENFDPDGGGGYNAYTRAACDFSALGPEVLAFRREAVEAVGGFAAVGESDLYAAGDLCFRLRAQGLLAVSAGPAEVRQERAAVRPMGFSALRDAFAESTLWRRSPAAFRRDVLFNPAVSFADGYPQLERG